MAIIILAIIVLGFVFADFIVDIDFTVNDLIGQFRTPSGLNLFRYITLMGSTYFILFFSAVLSFFLWRLPLTGVSCVKVFWFVFICNAGTGYLLKYFINRDRPIGAEIFESSFYSFPSGHVLNSFFFYGFIAFLIFRFMKINIKIKYFLSSLLLLIIILIGLSRLYLGVHFLSDVVAGYLIGWFWLNMALFYMRDIRRERKLNVVNTSL